MTTTLDTAAQAPQTPNKKQSQPTRLLQFPAHPQVLTATQRTGIETLIKCLNERANLSVTRHGDRALSMKANNPKVQRLAEHVFNFASRELFENDSSLSRNAIRTEWATQARIFDQTTAVKKTGTPAFTGPKPVTHSVETVSELPNNAEISQLLTLLLRKPKALRQLNPFKNMLHADVDVDGDKGFKIFFPVFEQDSLTNQYREEILNALSHVSNDFATGRTQRLDEALVARAIRNARDNREMPQAKTPSRGAPVFNFASLDVTPIAYDRINGLELSSFAEYIMNGRNSSFRALSEDSSVAFNIQAKTDGKKAFFLVTFPGVAAPLPRALQTQAEYFLAILHNKFNDGKRINKEVVASTIPEMIKALKEHTDVIPGDMLSSVFVNVAKEGGATFIDRIEERTEAPVSGAPKVLDMSAPVHDGPFTPKVNFLIPAFDKNGAVKMMRNGMPVEMTPTKNQQKLIAAIRDPEVQIIFCQGPAGSGKTLWTAYAALELLQNGHLVNFSFDRPLTGVEGEEIGFLKGDKDEKMAPFNGVFEEKCAEILGHGDITAGFDILQKLKDKGMFSNYQGMFKRGDTLYDSMLMLDEAQNKTQLQLFHYMTRLDDRSKLMLAGDGEFQVDLRNKKQGESGFIQAIEIYGKVRGVAVIELGAEDIKRSRLVADLYRARKAFEAASNGVANNNRPQAQERQATQQTLAPKGL